MFDSGLPVLGICYGQQTMCEQLGGKVEAGHHREFGRAFIEIDKECALFDGIWADGLPPSGLDEPWRPRHRDPGWLRSRRAPRQNAPFAFIANEAQKFYARAVPPGSRAYAGRRQAACQFRPQDRRPQGRLVDGRLSRQGSIAEIRKQVGDKRVICGLSGGVDSSVAALLIHEAVGDQLTCILVDHGLMRKNEAADVVAMFREHYNLPLVHVDASDLFINALEGESDPETKRKTIGRLFIDVFEAEAKKLGGAEFLAQGTLYPDVIESVSFTGGPSVTIKSHHNVGGLPDAHEHEAGRAAARAVQGRGPRARQGARPAG